MKYLLITFSLLVTSLAAAQRSDVTALSLPKIYALPVRSVEKIVTDHYQDICGRLISSYTQGRNDPAKLSRAEFCAVQHYSGGSFQVNQNLWLTDRLGTGLNGLQWAYVRVLDSALKKIKNEQPRRVFRGAARKHLPLPKPGGTFRLRGYTSTSVRQEVAEEFIQDRLMIIKVISGKNIRPYSNAGMEDEYLLPRNTLVRFDRSEMKTLTLFTDNGPEERKVEVVYLTEVVD